MGLAPREHAIARCLTKLGTTTTTVNIVTVTEQSCSWCGDPVPGREGPGRPRKYCRRSHRQRHFEARKVAARLGLASDDVLISRADYDDLRDRIYLLEAALQDVERDLAVSSQLSDYADAYLHLLEGALAIRNLRIEPRALQ